MPFIKFNPTEELVMSILKSTVEKVRKELAENYDVITPGSVNEKYTDLCHLAVCNLYNKLRDYSIANNIDIKFTGLHGEQKHGTRLHSSLWQTQHTWAMVEIYDMVIYVDPTSSQFQKFYPDIPDYYISVEKPKWFYADMDNPVYDNIVVKLLNNIITVKRKVVLEDEVVYPRQGIVEFMQYEIWGRICDSLNKDDKYNI